MLFTYEIVLYLLGPFIRYYPWSTEVSSVASPPIARIRDRSVSRAQIAWRTKCIIPTLLQTIYLGSASKPPKIFGSIFRCWPRIGIGTGKGNLSKDNLLEANTGENSNSYQYVWNFRCCMRLQSQSQNSSFLLYLVKKYLIQPYINHKINYSPLLNYSSLIHRSGIPVWLVWKFGLDTDQLVCHKNNCFIQVKLISHINHNKVIIYILIPFYSITCVASINGKISSSPANLWIIMVILIIHVKTQFYILYISLLNTNRNSDNYLAQIPSNKEDIINAQSPFPITINTHPSNWVIRRVTFRCLLKIIPIYLLILFLANMAHKSKGSPNCKLLQAKLRHMRMPPRFYTDRSNTTYILIFSTILHIPTQAKSINYLMWKIPPTDHVVCILLQPRLGSHYNCLLDNGLTNRSISEINSDIDVPILLLIFLINIKIIIINGLTLSIHYPLLLLKNEFITYTYRVIQPLENREIYNLKRIILASSLHSLNCEPKLLRYGRNIIINLSQNHMEQNDRERDDITLQEIFLRMRFKQCTQGYEGPTPEGANTQPNTVNHEE